ncbi:uncharacterized protein LOC128682176 [Plodia interpunctella]|uniref:uncharacterized protein LOC128682176 n=1 Tax=Plodia interpunctella TaxID=58824 RepID=UPI002367E1A2|nr:uncharacterized protein LOC128682176 [Plodia interpunctella]
MPNGFGDACYLLLLCIKFILNILYSFSHIVLFIGGLVVKYIFDVTMTESSKKRKRKNSETSQTVIVRGIINANWQKFLSNNLLMDTKASVPISEGKETYTGTFRRARKKKNKKESNVEHNLKSLNIDNKPVVTKNTVHHGKLDTELVIKEDNVNNANKKKCNLTKFLAIDCEMVGVGYEGGDHMLARVSIVNKFGDCVYDKFVKAREEVVDYRTDVSGVRKEDLINGEDFSTVQKEVAEIIRGRVLVGHSLKNDLSVLFLSHPKRNVRDTSRYKPFRKVTKGSTPSLKRLAKEILGIEIQHGEHSSVEDARAAMQLYNTVAKNWEAMMSEKRGYYRRLLDES